MRKRDSRYDAYINGPEWKAKRAAYKKEHGWSCYACGETKGLHLHHLTYERFGQERLTDLRPLCQRCHTEAHALVASRRTSLLGSADAVRSYRGGPARPPKQLRRKRQKKRKQPQQPKAHKRAPAPLPPVEATLERMAAQAERLRNRPLRPYIPPPPCDAPLPPLTDREKPDRSV